MPSDKMLAFASLLASELFSAKGAVIYDGCDCERYSKITLRKKQESSKEQCYITNASVYSCSMATFIDNDIKVTIISSKFTSGEVGYTIYSFICLYLLEL